MQNTGKSLSQRVLPKVCLPKRDISSKINTLFQKKNDHKPSHTKRYKSKPKSHVKTIGSILSKRKQPEFSGNGKRKNSLAGIRIRRKPFHKASGSTSPEELLSSMFHGRKSSSLSRKSFEKNNDEDGGTQKIDKRRKQKKRRKNGELDEASRLQRRTRYLLIKMKLEQNLIDAYSGEGWKGQSREKIRPEKELQRANKQILKCKLGIRDAIHQLELLSSEGCIEESVIGPDGSIFHEHIFCAKCKLRDAFPDNDIILCDGTCNCAFHQKCLEPPLATENIPPGDQGWFCKFCECKMEILEGINAHLGTQFSATSNWQDIFREAASVADCENATIAPEDQWPSDDSEDDDYDPDENEKSFSCSRTGTAENMSDASSSVSLLCTSEEEASLQSGGLRDDGAINEIDSDGSPDHAVNGRRQRRDVDYKKLHDEMFGKDLPENEQLSEDEDWGPGRRKRRENESDVAGTLVALHVAEKERQSVVSVEAKRKQAAVSEDKRTLFRIPPDAVETLRKVFAENELPSRDVREDLSKKLDLAFEKVNKWFKNARYTALKIRKAERIKQLPSTSGVIEESDAIMRKTQTTNQEPSKNSSYFITTTTEIPMPKISRKVHSRKNTETETNIPSKRRQRERDAAAHANNENEVGTQMSTAMDLKRQKMSRGERIASSEKRRVQPPFLKNKEEQLYLAEIERLCHVENKLEKLKRALSRLFNEKNGVSGKPYLDEEPSIIYVPVAQVREKA